MGLGLNSIVSLAVGILAVWAIAADSAHHLAPAPAADCSSVIMNLADCLSFVTDGSTVPKPAMSCCSGLKTVLKANPDCLCEEFKNSAGLGVSLNLTKAVTLPTACHVTAPPSVKNCIPSGKFFPSPSAAPSASPGINSAPTVTPAASATAPAASSPSPSQVNSASSPVAATLSAAACLVALLF
ncbi:unnamed protein product [Cuscuta campestris]|uniref:Bifunctional inhibitor/plant lipid transfer protein/seed storage helical domain-containing protein n=1 Tax=Cuscuta campestris TaxID=132261 RepID=A0A484MK23_9ASTE|nr:unnamed protein product [Cuscuta campestris]